MRFIVDENAGPSLAEWLRNHGHDVFSIYEQARGLDDLDVIEMAFKENCILITCDKDFGEIIFREHRKHNGVILLRLDDERNQNKIAAIERVLRNYSDRLTYHFTVVTETKVRITGLPSE
jgi:predicted nuclease of predicted toxin-antitoxin system